MIAVLEIGSKQYKVKEGSIIDVELIDEEQGKTIEFKTVVLTYDKGNTEIGMPYLDVIVKAEVINQFRDKKKVIFKFKKKTGYKLTAGHRQSQTTIKIISIKSSKKKEAKTETSETKSASAKKVTSSSKSAKTTTS